MNKTFLISQLKIIQEHITTLKKIAVGQGSDYITGCLLDYNYLNNYYKVMTRDLSKRKALNTDPNAIQQIDFMGNLAQ